MKPFDRKLDADVQDELDRLDAALRGDESPDSELDALVADVRAGRSALDADAHERLEVRAQEAMSTPAARGTTAGAGAAAATGRHPGRLAQRRWRAGLAVAAVVAVSVPVAAFVINEESNQGVSENLASGEIVVDSSTKDPMSSPESAARRSDTTESLEPTPPSTSGDVPAPSSPSVAPGTGSTSSSGTTLRKDRSVIRDASQTVRVERSEIAAAAGRVSEVVADQGGYVGSSAVSESGSSPRAEFEIVVPSARLDATIAAIGRIGKPVRLERSSVDVTDQRVSLDDRLRDLRADRSAARLQLARATEADRRSAKRRELRLLSSRIARLESEQRELRQQVSTARLSLRLVPTTGSAASDRADDDGWGLSDAWDDARSVLQVVAGVLLVAAVILIPLALVVALVAVGIGRLGSRRKNRTIDGA